jgi:glycosyltransferase involved in cell wall biosynthesis
MRVLFLTREYPPHSVGGIAKHVFWLSKSLIKLGVECRVLSFGNPSDTRENVTFVPSTSSLSPTKVKLKENLMVLQNIHKIDQLANDIFRAERFDILHIEDSYLGPFVKTCNTVTTIHTTRVGELISMVHNIQTGSDLKHAAFSASLGPILEHSTLARTDAVIAVNSPIKDELRRYYMVSENKINVIPNGIIMPSVLCKDKAKKQLGFPRDRVVIFSACRLIPRKRLDVLIRAVEILVKNGINNLLVIVCGDGPQRFFLQNLVATKDLDDWVKFTGWVSEELLQLHYEAADIFVLTSDYEGHPISLLEALSHGDASVCSDIPSVMLTDGVNGLLFRRGNHKHLAAKLEVMIQDAELRSSISKAGKGLAGRFDWQKVALATKSLYERLIS